MHVVAIKIIFSIAESSITKLSGLFYTQFSLIQRLNNFLQFSETILILKNLYNNRFKDVHKLWRKIYISCGLLKLNLNQNCNLKLFFSICTIFCNILFKNSNF